MKGFFAFGGAGAGGLGAGESLRSVYGGDLAHQPFEPGAAGLLGIPGVTLLILINTLF